MKLILGFVGHIGSGKGAACKYLQEKHDIGYYRYSTMLRDMLTRLYLPQDRDHMIHTSEMIRREFGENIIGHVMKEDVMRDTHEIVCIDGIRRLEDLFEHPNLVLVFINSDERVRFERLAARAENTDDTKKTFEEFLADEKRSTELTIDTVAARATETIYNNGTIEEFQAALDALITKHAN